MLFNNEPFADVYHGFGQHYPRADMVALSLMAAGGSPKAVRECWQRIRDAGRTVGWAMTTADEVLAEAALSASATHDTAGIRGARAPNEKAPSRSAQSAY
jgi:hypothetical protein